MKSISFMAVLFVTLHLTASRAQAQVTLVIWNTNIGDWGIADNWNPMIVPKEYITAQIDADNLESRTKTHKPSTSGSARSVRLTMPRWTSSTLRGGVFRQER